MSHTSYPRPGLRRASRFGRLSHPLAYSCVQFPLAHRPCLAHGPWSTARPTSPSL